MWDHVHLGGTWSWSRWDQVGSECLQEPGGTVDFRFSGVAQVLGRLQVYLDTSLPSSSSSRPSSSTSLASRVLRCDWLPLGWTPPWSGLAESVLLISRLCFCSRRTPGPGLQRGGEEPSGSLSRSFSALFKGLVLFPAGPTGPGPAVESSRPCGRFHSHPDPDHLSQCSDIWISSIPHP